MLDFPILYTFHPGPKVLKGFLFLLYFFLRFFLGLLAGLLLFDLLGLTFSHSTLHDILIEVNIFDQLQLLFVEVFVPFLKVGLLGFIFTHHLHYAQIIINITKYSLSRAVSYTHLTLPTKA